MLRPAILALATLTCSSMAACRAPPPPMTDAGSGGTPTATAAPIDAGSRDAPTHAEALEIFLEAARTNLARPYPAGRPESDRLYFEASNTLPDPERRPPAPAAMLVPKVLGQSDDPRAAQALVEWARAPEARPYLSFIVDGMSWNPNAAYAETVSAILANPELAGELSKVYGNSLALAIGIDAQGSLYAQALDLAVTLPGGTGRALVERIAADRKASAPNPRTLAAFECRGGRRIENEAQALASVRIMALAALADRALWVRVAADPSETSLVREWAKRMARGRVEKGPSRNWREQRLEAELFWSSVRDRDFMPCVSDVPGKRRPSPREGER